MGRPADWTPLLDRDPVPGDPVQVAAEARHLATIAREIQGQVARLRAIANNHADLKGEYVEKLKSVASDVAGSLDKVVGRYQRVSSALTKWVPELEYAQAESMKALLQAQDAHHDLAAAQARLTNAINHRNTHAQARAAEIKNAIDDGVADSWWDGVKDFIDKYSWLIKDICTALEVIATILALVALAFTGAGVLVVTALALAATGLALIGRTMLAAAGDGSWMDVALDVFALATFGLGKVMTSLMKSTFAASEDVAKGLIQAERDSSLLGKAGNLAGQVADIVQNNPFTKVAVSLLDRVGLGRLGEGLAGLTEKTSELLEKASAAALEKASPSLETTLATVPEKVKLFEKALYGGEEENLMLARKMSAIVARFPESPEIAQLNSRFATRLNFARGIFGSSVAVDQWDKWVGGLDLEGPHGHVGGLHLPGTDFYGGFKESWKTEGGLW